MGAGAGGEPCDANWISPSSTGDDLRLGCRGLASSSIALARSNSALSSSAIACLLLASRRASLSLSAAKASLSAASRASAACASARRSSASSGWVRG